VQPRIYGPYQHRDRWRVAIRIGGKTRYKSFALLAHAEEYIAGARDEAQGITVGHAMTALLDEMRAAGLAASTITTAEFRLDHILGAHRQRPIRWLTYRGAEVYRAACVDRSADTHHAELALASRACALAVKRRWLRADPFADVEAIGRKQHGRNKQRLRVDESRTLWDWCLVNASDQGAVITLAYLVLGARASELVLRRVRDLDDDGRLLWIEDAKTPTGNRQLGVPDPLRGMLVALGKGRAPDAPLFVDEDGEGLDRHWAYRRVRSSCSLAGVPVVPPQALRRTHADVATDAGLASDAVAAHLGHTSAVVTDRSYRDKQVTQDARQERAFKVIAGGKR
jgi:integrase